MRVYDRHVKGRFTRVRGHSNSHTWFEALFLTAACAALTLSGCTLLPMKNLQPVIAPPTGGTCGADRTFLRNETSQFHYTYPHEVTEGRTETAIVDNFEAYNDRIKARVESKLPAALAQNSVTNAFREFLTSVSGEAQLDAQVADRTLNTANAIDASKIANERTSIQKHTIARNLKHAELKKFANLLFDLQLKQGPADLTNASTNLDALGPRSRVLVATRPKIDTTLVAYLKAYYDGQFYDRMGTAISKPQLPGVNNLTNFSIPDSEIVAAETVLLEFLVDCIDPTPVMGDKDDHPTGTTYYPGASTNEPTALTTGLASYVKLLPDGCGITLKNVWVLKDLANAASDHAAAVGGLVVNTTGGISFGLGILGKISIGDNQTLSDLVKTAASDLALRATLATSYFSLRHVTFNPVIP
jgi:hypothetical protein